MTTPSASPTRRRAAAARAATSDLGDPSATAAWSIVSYVLSGIIVWGALGWLVNSWLFDGTARALIAFGVIIGAILGGYLGYQRFVYVSQQLDAAVQERAATLAGRSRR